MKPALLLALLLAPWSLAAELRLFAIVDGIEQPVGESYIVGSVPIGDSLDTKFRIKNLSESELLVPINVAGVGFHFPEEGNPKWPVVIAAGGTLDFYIRFTPMTPGSFSAYLNINGVRMTTLYGTAAAGVTISLVHDSGKTSLNAGDTIDFGSAVIGSKVVRRFEIANPAGVALSVNRLALTGEAFRGPSGLAAPFALDPGRTASFEVTFEPAKAGLAEGSLALDSRIFVLRGFGIEPDYPQPRIVIEPGVLRGGQQAKVSVQLDSASRYDGEGELALELKPSVSTKGDPAVLFLASGAKSIKFRVAAGLDAARFGDRADAEFQTGTTAGTLVLTATLGKHTVQAQAEIPPAAVVVNDTRIVRSATGFEVRVTGFDTSRTASRVAFTFYDRDFNVVPPGAISTDVAGPFRRYFDNADLGGMFLLRAVFQVSGDPLKIIAVVAELTNAHGATKTDRVGIP